MSQTADVASISVGQAKLPSRGLKRIHWLPYMLALPIILYEGVMLVYPIITPS